MFSVLVRAVDPHCEYQRTLFLVVDLEDNGDLGDAEVSLARARISISASVDLIPSRASIKPMAADRRDRTR